MAKTLKIKVVAEGVETPMQLDVLKRLRCDYSQGYLFSKPVSADEFAKLLVRGLGAGLALYLHENKTYKPPQARIRSLHEQKPLAHARTGRAAKQDDPQQHPPAGLSGPYGGLDHIRFIGDAAVNYSTNEVSDVKKATTLACIFPGAGQIYNKSYWKVPFVVGGFAAMIYCIDWNNRGYQRFKKGIPAAERLRKESGRLPRRPDRRIPRPLLAGLHPQPAQQLPPQPRPLHHHLGRTVRPSDRGRPHVDAHLKDYDVSDDLSMNLEPLVDYTYVPSAGGNRAVFGFNLSFKF